MFRTAIWIATVAGVVIGVLSAMADSVGTMVVMGLVGAAFGCPLGAGLGALMMALKRESSTASRSFCDHAINERIAFDPLDQMNIGRKWVTDSERSDFPIAGDPDPAAKAITGWHDAADIARSRDIF